MNQPSLKNKIIATALYAIFPGFWLLLMTAIFWETVSIQCQPSPAEVICKIYGETEPGKTRILEIPKSQIAEITIVDIVDRRRKGKYRIGFVTTDRQKIPLTRNWSGDATVQLKKQLDRISTFIADPQAKVLTVETQRRLPFSAWIMTIGVLGFSGWFLKRIWIGR